MLYVKKAGELSTIGYGENNTKQRLLINRNRKACYKGNQGGEERISIWIQDKMPVYGV